MKIFFIALFLFLLTGCNYENKDKIQVLDKETRAFKPAIKKVNENITKKTPVKTIEQKNTIKPIDDQAIKLKELSSKTKIELAKIESKTKLDTQSIELTAEVRKQELQRDIALSQQKHDVLVQTQEYDFYKIALFALTILTLILFFVIYFIKRKNNETKIAMQEREIQSTQDIKQFEEHNKRINKMLDIVTTGDLPENTQTELLGILKDLNAPTKPIDNNKKRLFFKG